MKWPWVSRERHEETVSLWRHQADVEHENAQTLRREISELAVRYHQLKLQGFSVAAEPKPIERPKPDMVRSAILQKAGSDRALQALMARQATEDRAVGMTDEQIVLKIHRGVSLDDAADVLPSGPGESHDR